MKKVKLFKRENGENVLVGTYKNKLAAEQEVLTITEDNNELDEDDADNEDAVTVFDFFTEEVEDAPRVTSYEEACERVGVEPLTEERIKALELRPDEVARKKLEVITAALNEGWSPDWNNTNEYKYYPYFYIESRKRSASAGLSCAHAKYAASYTYASIGSRLCFHDHETARYAGKTFTELYEQLLLQ
ncbi:MAG: hypothetical protein IJX55_06435 [Clostridia bacterium]|nr:hypothetical protein [Clostridia bacterium]